MEAARFVTPRARGRHSDARYLEGVYGCAAPDKGRAIKQSGLRFVASDPVDRDASTAGPRRVHMQIGGHTVTMRQVIHRIFLDPVGVTTLVVVGGSLWLAWHWFGPLGFGILGAFYAFGLEPLLRWLARRYPEKITGIFGRRRD